MAVSVVKETIELEEVRTDATGNAWLTKRVNLGEGKRHRLLQVDAFADAYIAGRFDIVGNVEAEIVISPYPSIPTDMQYNPSLGLTNRFPAAGDDSVLFKERRQMFPNALIDTNATQFPSAEISALNTFEFYTDHVYINVHLMTDPDTVISNIAYSFLMVLNDKNVPYLEHALGVLAESHEAMCALIMSNGHMVSISNLRGNTFPSWRFGGIRPENTIPAIAANSFFLEIDTRDAEDMIDTGAIRQAVADARKMSPFDAAFGEKRPDWLKLDLNQGLIAGPVRSDPVPLKFADNGNTLMF